MVLEVLPHDVSSYPAQLLQRSMAETHSLQFEHCSFRCTVYPYARDQLKLDFKWIVSEEDDDRTLAEMIAQIKEEATSIASAVAELEKLIGEVEE